MTTPPGDLSSADLLREQLALIERLKKTSPSSPEQRRRDSQRFFQLDAEGKMRRAARSKRVTARQAAEIRARRRAAAPSLDERVAAAKRALGIRG